MTRLIERLLILAVSLAIAIGIIALLSGGLLAGRDAPGVSGGVTGPGMAYADQGDAVLRPGQKRPRYDSRPPTSGPHLPRPVDRDRARLSDDQLLQALQSGDVVLMYGSRRPPAGLAPLARRLAPRFSPALSAAGMAIILARRPGVKGVVALAWAHMLRVRSAHDPALGPFARYWLGRGAPGRSRNGPGG